MDKVEKFISAAETLIEFYRQDNNLEEDEPLDGDDVDSLVDGVRNFINLHQGNITQEEFYELEGDLDMDVREVTLKIDVGKNFDENKEKKLDWQLADLMSDLGYRILEIGEYKDCHEYNI